MTITTPPPATPSAGPAGEPAVRDDLVRLVIDGTDYPLRVSVGSATSNDASTALNLLHEADLAMYADKRERKAACTQTSRGAHPEPSGGPLVGSR